MNGKLSFDSSNNNFDVQPSWTHVVVDSDIGTIDTGVAFTSDSVGYTAGATNGVGPQAFTTKNGGATWCVPTASKPCPCHFVARL